MSSFLRDHVSAQYKVALQISIFTILIFILLNPSLGNPFLLEKASFSLLSRVVNPGGCGSRPPYFGQGGRVEVAGRVAGGSLGSWTGREILLYLIMYRKYVPEWLLLKINRIICPKVAVNGHFLLGKSNIFNCLKKSKFSEISL